MTSSPRFSPDGQKIVMSLQQGGNANIFIDGPRLAHHHARSRNTNAIDTSPSFSPDGREIVFESDRGGQQQIYVMGGRRLQSAAASRSAKAPTRSRPGRRAAIYIAFTKRRAGGFAIGIMKPDGSGERILTEGFHNEGPTWAPNGQYVMFFRDPGGQARRQALHGRHHRPGRAAGPDPPFASDPTWSPLLTEARPQ